MGIKCSDWALESMTWYNRLRFIYKFIYLCFLVSLYNLICINWLFEHTYLHHLHCAWLRYVRSCTEDPSHGFLAKWWVVHSWFMDLGNQFEIVVHYLLIKGMPCLSHRDGFTMVSALVCMMHTRQDITIHQITILHGFSTSRGYWVRA